MMFLFSVVFLSLYTLARAGHNSLNDYPARLHKPLHFEPFQNSTCSVLNLSSLNIQSLSLQSEICPAIHKTPQSSSPPKRKTSPWTNTPTCSNTTSIASRYCVYTSATFANNRGVTFLTTPKIARLISRLPAFSSSLQPSAYTDSRPPPFEVVQIPGRGMGLIANRTIERGDRIKSHSAIAIIANDAFTKNGVHNPLMHQAISQLPHTTQALFNAMAAHDGHNADPVIEKLNTNTFGEPFGDVEHSVVVPETARLNHDCRPNAMYYFDRETLVHYTHASRRIYAGEEITITYTDVLQTRRARRKALHRSWGFDCDCSLCNAPQQFIVESNRRIGEILRLSQNLSNLLQKPASASQHPDTKLLIAQELRKEQGRNVVAMAELLVSLYEQERLYASVADAYRLAALAYSSVGREFEALRWAHKAVGATLIHDGVKSVDVKDMRTLLGNVRKHWSWEILLKDREGKEGCACGHAH